MTFDPKLPVRQRNGRGAIIMGVVPRHLAGSEWRIVALVEGYDNEGWSPESYKLDGSYRHRSKNRELDDLCQLDLVNVDIPDIKSPSGRCTHERKLLRTFPVLAQLCRIEALADQRADNTVCAMSKLTEIVSRAREAITALIDRRENPIYPHRWAPTEGERWAAMHKGDTRSPISKPLMEEAAE